jgi:hypothetical protein
VGMAWRSAMVAEILGCGKRWCLCHALRRAGGARVRTRDTNRIPIHKVEGSTAAEATVRI